MCSSSSSGQGCVPMGHVRGARGIGRLLYPGIRGRPFVGLRADRRSERRLRRCRVPVDSSAGTQSAGARSAWMAAG